VSILNHSVKFLRIQVIDFQSITIEVS